MTKKIILTLCAVLLAGAALFLYLALRETEPYIAKIDGTAVLLSEYYVYLYEQKIYFESRGGLDIWDTDFDGETSENIAKQNALAGLQLVKLSVKEARRTGLFLTAEEEAYAAAAAEELFAEMGAGLTVRIGLTLPKLTEIMTENELYHKLFTETTKSYEPNEKEFMPYFKDYYEENRHSLETRTLQFIKTADWESAAHILEEAADGGNFDDLVLQYAPEQAGMVYDIGDENVPPEVSTAAQTLSAGETAPLVETSGGFYAVRVAEVIKPDMEALYEALLQAYVNEEKSRIFSEQYQSRTARAKIKTNRDIWEATGIADLKP